MICETAYLELRNFGEASR